MQLAQRYRDLVSGHTRGPVAAAARGILGVAAFFSKQFIQRRNRRYDREIETIHQVDAPVICVGNVTMGGTGKTPMVHYLACWFREQGIRVGLVSRGYGAGQGEQNDEARELAERLPDVPHIQNPDRVAAANVAIDELEMQLIVLDDGFQHRRLARDLDIVLLDALQPFGFEHVVPRGMLREPLEGIRRAQIVALSRANLISAEQRASIRQRVATLHPTATWLELAHTPTALLDNQGQQHDLATLRNARVLAFCGLGNPAGFRSTLENCGVELVDFHEFPDHHDFTRDDLDWLTKWTDQHKPSLVICTHKDLVKIDIDQLAGVPLRALQVNLEVLQGEPELHVHLASLKAKVDGK